jgi:ABC-type antimicrobial peptide transport system permease subunit
MKAGRNLNASDANSNNIVLPAFLNTTAPFKGKFGVGTTITMISPDGKHVVTLTVVGLYTSSSVNFSSVLTSKSAIAAISPAGDIQSIFSMKIDPTLTKQALAKIAQIAPTAIAFDLSNIGDFVNQYLNDAILVLITIASLSLFAGVIIIANAVALAMLERRRELGILKSVGYTSSNAMLLVALATNLLGIFLFKSTFAVNGWLVLILIGGTALLAVITSLLVAWSATRVRPLTVLRYE